MLQNEKAAPISGRPEPWTVLKITRNSPVPQKETAVIGKEYKYTVEIDGYPPLDPIGVVKP